MSDKPKISMHIPPGSLIDPTALKIKQLQEEEERRFSKIATQIVDILIKENILVREIPRLVSVVTNKINQKIDNSPVEKVLKL